MVRRVQCMIRVMFERYLSDSILAANNKCFELQDVISKDRKVSFLDRQTILLCILDCNFQSHFL